MHIISIPPNCVNICTADDTSNTLDIYHNNGSDKCKRGREVRCDVPEIYKTLLENQLENTQIDLNLHASKYWHIGATINREFEAFSHSVINILKTASAAVWGSSSKNVESAGFTLYKAEEAIKVNEVLEQWESDPNKRFIVGKCRSTKNIYQPNVVNYIINVISIVP